MDFLVRDLTFEHDDALVALCKSNGGQIGLNGKIIVTGNSSHSVGAILELVSLGLVSGLGGRILPTVDGLKRIKALASPPHRG